MPGETDIIGVALHPGARWDVPALTTCIKCGQVKSTTAFVRDKNRSDGRYPYCKTCVRGYSVRWYKENREKVRQQEKQWRANNPEKTKEMHRRAHRKKKALDPIGYALDHRRSNLRHQYGLSLEEYNAMRVEQNDACGICGTTEVVSKNGHLTVDHDHKTGRVRALLCVHCNALIAYAKEDIEILSKAIQYLEMHNAG